MRATLGRAEDYRGSIVKFRTQLSRQIGFAASCRDAEPLPFAFYLFAWDESDSEPSGMLEFFLYDQAFDSYADCPYAQVFDLEHIAPMDRIVHVRSLVANDGEHQSALLQCLSEALAAVANELGARYLTADAALLESGSLKVSFGPTRSARYRIDGVDKTLSLVGLKPIADRPDAASATDADSIDSLLLHAIRLRGRCAFAAKTKPAVRLDRLLPAHWVGVWQRQLRAYAA
jgi:hypothetical protein